MTQEKRLKEARHKRGRRPRGEISGREALIRAANTCFLRLGYAASLRDIAAEAEVDMALVARLFGSKKKLWEAVIAWHESKLAHHLSDVDALSKAGLPTKEALQRLIELYAGHCVDLPFIALFMHEAVNHGPRLENIVERLVVPLRPRYLPFLNRAIEQRIVHALDPELALTILLTGISAQLAAPMLCSGRGEGKELARRLVKETCILLGLQLPTDSTASPPFS